MSFVDPARWGSYNAAQAERPVRPLAEAAVALAGPGMGRVAVELGCGAGVEARFLAEHGWTVHTVDADPSVVPALNSLAERLPIHHTVRSLEDVDELPACDLLLACASLPFIPAQHFGRIWQAITTALRPGAVLAFDLFGDRDDWADGPGSHFTRAQLDTLLSGLDVHQLHEEECDGRSFSGPKHWHTYHVLAAAPPAP